MPAIFDKGRRRGLALIAALALAQGAAAGAAALATRVLFGGLHAGAPASVPALATIALAGVVIAASRISFAVIGDRLGQNYALDIREALFRHATGLAASDVAARRAGFVSLRFVGDMAAFKAWLAKGLPNLIAGLVQVPVLIAVMFLLNPVFGLIGLGLFASALALMMVLARRLAGLHQTLRSRRATIAADMSDLMPVAHDLGQLDRTKTEIRRLRKSTMRMIEASLARAQRAEVLVAIADITAATMAALILWRAYADALDTGVVAGALAALGLGGAALRSVATALDRRGEFLAAEEKCAAALDRGRTRPRAGRRTLDRAPIALHVDGIQLQGHPALSFTVAAGARHELTGDAADTADLLFSTLQGREPCPHGRITINGSEISEIAPLSLRRRIGRLTTRPLILRGSLRRTLTLGVRRRPSDARLAELLSLAGLGGAMADLDRAMLQGGRDLTPTERARLSLVNASLNAPGLLLIDAEASALLGDLGDRLAALGIETATIITVGRA